LVRNGVVDSALLMIGANDVVQYLGSILAGHPEQFVHTVVTNITTAAATVASAGNVGLVVANIPDIGVTPKMQRQLNHDPVLLRRLTDGIALADQQINDVAASYRIPVIDLLDMSYLVTQPLEMGGVEVTKFFAPDDYHPGTVPQGIIANTFLAALNIGYGTDVSGLPMSDQEILTTAGIDHPPGETYLDVSGFVIFDPGSAARNRGPSKADPRQGLERATAGLDGGLSKVLSNANGYVEAQVPIFDSTVQAVDGSGETTGDFFFLQTSRETIGTFNLVGEEAQVGTDALGVLGS
jgi:hypothetical protein